MDETVYAPVTGSLQGEKSLVISRRQQILHHLAILLAQPVNLSTSSSLKDKIFHASSS